MSFVLTVPELLSAAAGQLQGIGSAVSAANFTAAFPITGVVPAAADEVSAATATIFARYGQLYQTISAEAAAIHEQFVRVLGLSAGSYAATDATNARHAGGGVMPGTPMTPPMHTAPPRPGGPAPARPTAPGYPAPARPGGGGYHTTPTRSGGYPATTQPGGGYHRAPAYGGGYSPAAHTTPAGQAAPARLAPAAPAAPAEQLKPAHVAPAHVAPASPERFAPAAPASPSSVVPASA